MSPASWVLLSDWMAVEFRPETFSVESAPIWAAVSAPTWVEFSSRSLSS
jgi:hypothetical protein